MEYLNLGHVSFGQNRGGVWLGSHNINIMWQRVENCIVLRKKDHHGLGSSSREEGHLLQSCLSSPPNK